MASTGQNFEIHQGDSKQLIITVNDYDQDGVLIGPLDLSGYDTFIWIVYRQTNKVAVLTKSLGDGITVPTPSNGQVVIDLIPTDTESINPAYYNHELEISVGGISDVATVTTGTVQILYSKA